MSLVRTSKQLWTNHQWAVTTYGLECLTENYAIEKKRLAELRPESTDLSDWPMHMAEKSWVNLYAFIEAFAKAFDFHKPAGREAINWDKTAAAARRIRSSMYD
jgi:hypothetical protein